MGQGNAVSKYAAHEDDEKMQDGHDEASH